MANSFFNFKQFRVEQANTAMKVGTDGVLLGAWCDVSGSRKVLDIGTGTGLLALMVAQRQPSAEVCAVDIESVEDARANFEASLWSDRLSVESLAIQDFVAQNEGEVAFNHIVSNPPYFVSSLKGDNAKRNTARHTDSLSFEQLAFSCSALLSADGHISLIIPSDAVECVLRFFEAEGLYAYRITSVFAREDSPKPKRSMLEFSRERDRELKEDSLVIETTQRHSYSEAYKALTFEFYLDK